MAALFKRVEVETIQLFINGLMGLKNLRYLHNGVYFDHKKINLYITNMDEPFKHFASEKIQTRKTLYYMIPLIRKSRIGKSRNRK